MTDVYFVRHGESTANRDKICAGHTDVELTELGIEQANQAGDELAAEKISIDIIISSPLQRALKTAYQIADKIGYDKDKIVISNNAIERFRGDYEGQPSSMQDGVTDEDYLRMGAESVDQLVHRAHALRDEIGRLGIQSVLVVSHNQFGCIFVAISRNETPTAELNKIPNAHVFKV